MAKDINVKLNFDTKEAQKSAGDLAKAVDSATSETKELNDELTKGGKKGGGLEDRLKQLNKTVKESPIDIRAMNKQIQEYQAIALEAGRTSPVGKAALKEAANLRDRYVDIQNEVKRLSNDGVKMQAALDLGTSIIGGYSAFKGVTTLLGAENEDLQKTLVKLQAAQSALMGIETIRKNLEKESTIVLVAKNAAEKASIVGTKILTTVNKALNVTLKANPIGVIVTALLALGGAVALAIDKLGGLTKVLGGVGDAVNWVGRQLGLLPSKAEEAANAQIKEAERVERENRAIERKKLQAVVDAEKEKREARTESYDFEIAKLQASGEATFDIEQEKLTYVLDSLAKQKEAIQDQIAFEEKQLEKGVGTTYKFFG